MSSKLARINPQYYFPFSLMLRAFLEGSQKYMKSDDTYSAADIMKDDACHSEESLQSRVAYIEGIEREVELKYYIIDRGGDEVRRTLKQLQDSIFRMGFTFMSIGVHHSDRILLSLIVAIHFDPGSKDKAEIFFTLLRRLGSTFSLRDDANQVWPRDHDMIRVRILEEEGISVDSIFLNVSVDINEHIGAWNEWALLRNPETSEMPPPFQISGKWLSRILLFAALRPDRLLRCIKLFVDEVLGEEFLSSVDSVGVLSLSNETTPLLLVDSDAWPSISSKCDRVIDVDHREPLTAIELIRSEKMAGRTVFVSNFNVLLLESQQCILLLNMPCSKSFRLFLAIPHRQALLKLSVEILNSTLRAFPPSDSSINGSLSASWSSLRGYGSAISSGSTDLKQRLLTVSLLHSYLRAKSNIGALGWVGKIDYDLNDLTYCFKLLLDVKDSSRAISSTEFINVVKSFVLDNCFSLNADAEMSGCYLRTVAQDMAHNGYLFPSAKLPNLSVMSYGDIVEFITGLSLGDETDILGVSPAVMFAADVLNSREFCERIGHLVFRVSPYAHARPRL
jgi:hypothetical protein